MRGSLENRSAKKEREKFAIQIMEIELGWMESDPNGASPSMIMSHNGQLSY